MTNRQVFKGASVLSFSQIIIAVATFVRNILVARLVSVEDYGIATTFAITLAMIEMASNLAFEKILVQDEKGGEDDMLASAHFLHFVKSLATGLVLFSVGPLMASLFDLKEVVWAFQLLALIPIIRGLSHFDTVTYQREMNFLPTAIIDALPQVLTVICAYPIGIWLEDYRVMLVLVLLQPLTYTVLTHIYAKRQYRWLVKKSLIKKKLNFAWPLLINGFLMFAVFNGDKAIIGHSYSMEVLGWYSVAFGLTMIPTLLFAKVCNTLLLPILAVSLRDDKTRFAKSCVQAVTFCCGVASFTLIFFIIAGSAVVFLCYGERYMEGAGVIVLLALMQSLRMIRIAPTIIAISYSHTKNAMYANIARVSVISVAVFFALNGFSIEFIVCCGVVGEIFALIVSTSLLRLGENRKFYLRAFVKNILFFVGFALIITLIVSFIDSKAETIFSSLLFTCVASVFSVLAFAGHLMFDKQLRAMVKEKVGGVLPFYL